MTYQQSSILQYRMDIAIGHIIIRDVIWGNLFKFFELVKIYSKIVAKLVDINGTGLVGIINKTSNMKKITKIKKTI